MTNPFLAAKDVLADHGWNQDGTLYSRRRGSVCILGALFSAVESYQDLLRPLNPYGALEDDHEAELDTLYEAVPTPHRDSPYARNNKVGAVWGFNDDTDTSLQDVLAVLDRAAEIWDNRSTTAAQ